MNLIHLKRNWNFLARQDALWAILSDPRKKGNRWDKRKFLRTGEVEITRALKIVNIKNVSQKSAVDFGCGVGRLSQALSRHFEFVYGVDISEEMIKKAEEMNKNKNIKFIVNDDDNLKIFRNNSIDFIYCVLVLQHMEPYYTKKYLSEFARILKEGGGLIFQIPSENSNFFIFILKNIKRFFPKLLKKIYKRIRMKGKIDMFSIKKTEIQALLMENGLKIISIEKDKRAGKNWVSYTYYVRK